jgi:ABC-2 type transport system ATP-binding protein
MTASITLEGVSKHLSGRQVLKDISFTVEPGDIFGCLGPNGAGKTTSIRIILGLLRASAGRVRVFGGDPGTEDIRTKIGFVLETDGLYDNLSARDNLAYYGRLYGIRVAAPRIDAVLEDAGLSDRSLDKVSTFSKGMRQRLALARSVLHEPEVLVLDEPTAGLDPGGQLDVRQTLLELSRRRGTTVFLSSHNLDEMQRLCNRIVLIHGGEIKLYGGLKELARGSGARRAVIETSAPVPPSLVSGLGAAVHAAVEAQAGAVVLTGGADFEVSRAVAYLVEHGVGIEQVIKRQDSLEDLYLRIEAEARAAAGEPDPEPQASGEGGEDV